MESICLLNFQLIKLNLIVEQKFMHLFAHFAFQYRLILLQNHIKLKFQIFLSQKQILLSPITAILKFIKTLKTLQCYIQKFTQIFQKLQKLNKMAVVQHNVFILIYQQVQQNRQIMYSSNSNCYVTPNRNNPYKNQNKLQTSRSQKKGKHIVQLKNELVKMKQYLNTQMPQINKIVPIGTSTQKLPHRQYQTDQQQQIHAITNQQINVLLNANMRLKHQNSFLAGELHREKDMQKKLSKSLKKHEQILNHFYDKQKQQLRTTSQSKNIFKKYKISEDSDDQTFEKLQKKQKASNKNLRLNSLQNRQIKQVVDIWHKRQNSGINAINSARSASQTSIMNSKEKNNIQKVKIRIKKPQRTAGFTQTDLQTIQVMQQINQLQQKMQTLMVQCRETENRTKKLHIRYQIQKIASKIHILKESVDNKY